MTREQLCEAMRSRRHLTVEEIDAVLADKAFFQPYLKEALARRARLGCVPDGSIDATDSHAVFLLTELADESIIPDLLECMRMSEEDLRLLYAESLTEHMWLPFAKVGNNALEELWNFINDTSVDLFARTAVVEGVIAMHHFHPQRRKDAVALVERLLDRRDCFPDDYLAGFLCDCADSGLKELTAKAKKFAARMEDYDFKDFPMAIANDIRKAFRDGFQKDYISGRPHDVYGVNKQWQRWAERERSERERVIPGWPAVHKNLMEQIRKAALSGYGQRSTDELREQLRLSRALSEVVTTEEEMIHVEEFTSAEVTNWLLNLSIDLARCGLVDEAAELGRVWANVTERELFLSHRAVILAEAGRKAQAHEQIDEVLCLYPANVWVRMNVADAQLALDELDSAELNCRLALKMADNDGDRKEILERFIALMEKLGRMDEAEKLKAARESLRKQYVTADREPILSTPYRRAEPKVGRNDPCPCGSGKKYKKCHGK